MKVFRPRKFTPTWTKPTCGIRFCAFIHGIICWFKGLLLNPYIFEYYQIIAIFVSPGERNPIESKFGVNSIQKCLENAVAERVNGILKQEWLNAYNFGTIEDVRPVLERIIDYYNTNRPHSSVDWLTPEEAHQRNGILKKHWKNKCYNKFVPIKEIANFKPLRRKILSEPFSFERLQMDYKYKGHVM